jgi:hypothetical protein
MKFQQFKIWNVFQSGDFRPRFENLNDLRCEVMNTKVLRPINIYKLMANPNVNNDFGNSLLGIIQTYISNLLCINSNFLVKCFDGSTNWHGNIIWVHKLVIKISNNFNNSGTHVVCKRIHVLHSFMKCYLNIQVHHTFLKFRIHIHFKIDRKAVLSSLLQNMKIHY